MIVVCGQIQVQTDGTLQIVAGTLCHCIRWLCGCNKLLTILFIKCIHVAAIPIFMHFHSGFGAVRLRYGGFYLANLHRVNQSKKENMCSFVFRLQPINYLSDVDLDFSGQIRDLVETFKKILHSHSPI